MTLYKAHYGSWKNGNSVHYIEGTYSRKEIFEKAQEAADMTGEIVTVISEKGSVNGIICNCFKVNPNR